MKKSVKLIVLVAFVVLSLASCVGGSGNGDKILIVTVDSDEDITGIEQVKESLGKGGKINLDVKTCRDIAPDFDEKYTASDSEGSFLVQPAILNFIGGNKWKLVDTYGLGWNVAFVFTKSR